MGGPESLASFCGKQFVPGVGAFAGQKWSLSICCLFKERNEKRGNQKRKDSILSPVVCMFFLVTFLLPYCCLMLCRRFRMDTMAIILKEKLIRWQVLLLFPSLIVQHSAVCQYSPQKPHISHLREPIDSIQCVNWFCARQGFHLMWCSPAVMLHFRPRGQSTPTHPPESVSVGWFSACRHRLSSGADIKVCYYPGKYKTKDQFKCFWKLPNEGLHFLFEAGRSYQLFLC